jgi:hypothetical protein
MGSAVLNNSCGRTDYLGQTARCRFVNVKSMFVLLSITCLVGLQHKGKPEDVVLHDVSPHFTPPQTRRSTWSAEPNRFLRHSLCPESY